jgi:hypothetical protein
MKQNAPTPSRAIQIVTLVCGGIMLAFFVAGFFEPPMFLAALFLLLIGCYCYFFWSAVAYELSGDTLTVFFRASRRQFRPVIRCSLIDGRLGMGIRLCGNGGVFGGSGIFWNRRFGVFRAYVTRSKPSELVLVETATRKILISPEDPAGLVGYAKSAGIPTGTVGQTTAGGTRRTTA